MSIITIALQEHHNVTTLLLSFGSFYVASGNVEHETERVGLALQSDAQVELHYSKEWWWATLWLTCNIGITGFMVQLGVTSCFRSPCGMSMFKTIVHMQIPNHSFAWKLPLRCIKSFTAWTLMRLTSPTATWQQIKKFVQTAPSSLVPDCSFVFWPCIDGSS